MKAQEGLSYGDAGVLSNQQIGLDALLKWVQSTMKQREGKPGESLIDPGYFAAVTKITDTLSLAITTDGVGSKVLLAQMMGRYDTIGIDCVAMNVNDLICVGAEPISMLDYVAVERADPAVLEAIGRGLSAGAEIAGINIVGGEISQIGEIVKGVESGTGLDLVGMAVGLVPTDKINVGQDVSPGDVILGLRSSGIHSNGLTLARQALFDRGGYEPDSRAPGIDRPLGAELLEPTRIYVREVLGLQRSGVSLKALVNITGDGLLNLTRIKAEVGFRIDDPPEPQPIFGLIQEAGGISDAEMVRVFNMGVGFCLIVPEDSSVLDKVSKELGKVNLEWSVIGRVVEDPEKTVSIPKKGLVGRGDDFVRQSDP